MAMILSGYSALEMIKPLTRKRTSNRLRGPPPNLTKGHTLPLRNLSFNSLRFLPGTLTVSQTTTRPPEADQPHPYSLTSP